jgi:hypothetical protein
LARRPALILERVTRDGVVRETVDVEEAPPTGGRRTATTPRYSMSSTRYEIRITGRLSPDIREHFEDFELTEAPIETVMLAEVVDESHLHGVLARLQSLGLQLLSLRSLPD